MKTLTLGVIWFLALILVPDCAHAQVVVHPTAKTLLVWEHPGTNVERFLLFVDDEQATGKPIDLGLPVKDASGSYAVPLPALTPGPHTLTLRAANIVGLSDGFTLKVSIIVAVPVPPSAARIETRP